MLLEFKLSVLDFTVKTRNIVIFVLNLFDEGSGFSPRSMFLIIFLARHCLGEITKRQQESPLLLCLILFFCLFIFFGTLAEHTLNFVNIFNVIL